ncbi:MAG: hypothetical protein CMJ62_18730 [Planctomycetaceae bacterium]|nr:hypothetical protein [Planctomycetaceae bacterium]
MMAFFQRRFAWLLLMPVLFAGCEKQPFSIPGVITLDGAAIGNAQIMFMPEGSDEIAVLAASDDEGRFLIVPTGGKAGLPAGRYKVIVVKVADASPTGPEMTESGVAEIYSRPETTPLTVDLPTGEVRLEVTSQ